MKGVIFTFFVCLLATSSSLVAQELPKPDALTEPPPSEVKQPEEIPAPQPEPAVEPAPDNTAGDTSTTAAVSEGMTTEPKPAEKYAKRFSDERYVAPKANLEGATGLQRIGTAWTGKPNTYNVALMTEFFSANDTVRFQDENTLFTGNLILQANFTEWISAHVRLGTRNNVNSFGRPEAMLSQGDVLFGAKVGFELSSGLNLGGDLNFDIPTDFGSSGLGFSGTNVRPRLIASIDFADMMRSDFQLHGHFNLGYRIDSTENLIPDNVNVTRVERFAYGLSAYDGIEIGLGFAYDLPYVTPFIEWNLEAPVNGEDGICNDPTLPCVSDAGFASWPNVLTLGAKAQFLERLGLHAGIDIGLTNDDAAGLPVTAPYTLVGGISWTIDPNPRIEIVEKEVMVEPKEVAPPERVLLGTVVDKETGAPIEGVIVRYPVSLDTPQATTAEGVFRTYGFAPGSKLKLALSHPDYEPIEFETLLEQEEGEQAFSVQLVPVPKLATVLGSIEDENGDPVKNARVTFTGPKGYTANATSGGRFSQDVTEGKYAVAVAADGFLTRGKDIEVSANDKLEIQFVLKPAPKESLVKMREDKIEIQQKIFFETGKANILPKSFGLLDQVTAALVENPQVKKIQIEGHTDDVGDEGANLDLSQGRAQSVRNYLIEQGVSPDRLDAKGYGEARPILPNTSKRNRSLNRRVEFRIINQ